MSTVQPAQSAVATASSVSVYDARPFFEKALQHGVRNGIIDVAKLESIRTDAPKGMVQIARYFGSEFLRPELEKARERIVNLVSLYLESSTGGDLQLAAESLRDYSFLSRSKGGSDMLKALIAMPQSSHFGMNERRGFSDDQIPLLAKWTLRSLADYQNELAERSQVAQLMDAAVWLADRLGMDAGELEEAGKDAEAVIRTALLAMALGKTDMPDWPAFEGMVATLRQKYAPAKVSAKTSKTATAVFEIPQPKDIKGLPAQWTDVVERLRQSVLADLPRIVDTKLTARQLFERTPAFIERYFWVEDVLSEINHHDRRASDAWNKVTGGNTDDGSLLTLLVCVAAGQAPKTLLTEKAASALIRKIQKSGFKPELAKQYILEHAPVHYQDDYMQLWSAFVQEAQQTLQSDAVGALADALTLLRRECHIKPAG